MKLSAILEPLVEAGVDAATILATVKAWEAQQADALEQRRANDRERQSRRRHVTSRDVTVTVSSREGVAPVEDKTSNSEIEPHSENKKRERVRASLVGFDDWYAGYPHKVQRGAAERAWPKAVSLAGSVEVLVAGRDRYIASKPVDRHWQNPATWLNGKGWLDAPANVIPMARGSPRPVESLIDSLLTDMDMADANATAKTQGYPQAPLRLPSH